LLNKRRKIKFSFGTVITNLYLLLFTIVILFPLLWMFSLSFRPTDKLFDSYFYIIPKFYTLDNYREAIRLTINSASIPSLPVMFQNSIIISVLSVVVAILLSALAAYALVKFKFKGNNTIFLAVLTTMMIPAQAILIPVFLTSKNLGLLNTYAGVILVYVAFNIPFTIFILRNFFKTIPIELSEAAYVDGASDMRILFSIYLPISKPAIAACVIFVFLSSWNELIFGMVLLQNKALYTVTVALSKFVGGIEYFPTNIFSSLLFITCIPIIIVFVIFQNWFIQGLTAGSVKG
jgi:ABC-type glycerol-3-phosphate transport system permease component